MLQKLNAEIVKWSQKALFACILCTRNNYKSKYRQKINDKQKTQHVDNQHKKAEITMLISDKIDLKAKLADRDKKKEYFIMIKM